MHTQVFYLFLAFSWLPEREEKNPRSNETAKSEDQKAEQRREQERGEKQSLSSPYITLINKVEGAMVHTLI